MPKILVADDNSNVQKTVALALAGLGVEVVSVNNGEAAVRKLSDFSPDLVLADIFMPVRNGYEVCEYVKKDSRYANVPVVLLVGAFDPLDEREAQRVGADGVLKKPFVPPDPLINMVKTLLERSMSARLVAVSVSAPAVAVEVKAASTKVAESPRPAAVPLPPTEKFEEAAAERLVEPVHRVVFGEGERPVAFGKMLETPIQNHATVDSNVVEPVDIEPVDDEQIITSSRDATLGDPIFWRNDSAEAEAEPERPAVVPSEFEARSWKQEEDALPRRDESLLLQPLESLELVLEEQVETAPSIIDSAALLLDPASQASLNVDSQAAVDLAANPIEWMATAPPVQPEEAAALEPVEAAAADSETIDVVEVSDTVPVSVSIEEEVAPPIASPEPLQADVIEHAIEPVKVEPVEQVEPVVDEVPTDPARTLTRLLTASIASTQSVEDTARSIPKQDWADMTAILQVKATEAVSRDIKSASATVEQPSTSDVNDSQLSLQIPTQEGSPDPALVEAVVQRVLERMRPQVVEIITKEFLRPIVQALVFREIEKH